MPQKIHIDEPEGELIEAPYGRIMGWCTTEEPGRPLAISLNGVVIAHSLMDRPDVRRVFPGVPSFGFTYPLTPEFCERVGDRSLRLRLELGSTSVEKTLRFSRQAVEAARDWTSKKRAKREWCLANALCPMCRAGRPTATPVGAVECPNCRASLNQQATEALNMLPVDLYHRFQLKETTSVSSHPYSPAIIEEIEQVRRVGGKVLDCGAGFRSTQDDTIINLEIVDYPSTDVLAVGQALPFADASFDLVLSLAVLEHVDDPFACAAEIARVVKPGGKIYCVAPFMTHEHGYPNHFFNMSRQGLVRLFSDKARVVSHEVPRYGLPIHSLCSFVVEYLENLPPGPRAELEKLTIGDLSRLRREDFWNHSFVRDLSREGNFMLAAVTAAIFVRN